MPRSLTKIVHPLEKPFEAGCCESVAREPQMDVIYVVHIEVTCTIWDVVVLHGH